MYVIWPKTIDEAFRPAYAAIVAEGIQDQPHETATHFMVGTSRMDSAMAYELKGQFPDIVYSEDFPAEFESEAQ